MPPSLLFSAVAGLLLLLLCAAVSAWRAGLWTALASAGYGASLALVDAGPSIGYSHLRPERVTEGWGVASLVVLVFQATAVAFGLRCRLSAWWAWIRARLGIGGAILVGSGMTLLAAFPSLEPERYAAELVLGASIHILHLLTVLLAVAALPDSWASRLERYGRRWLNPLKPASMVGRLVATAAAAAVLTAAGLAWWAYEAHPHIPDEVGYLFQARVFASGRLVAPAPPVPDAFETYMVDCNADRCLSPFPPGWPALLAVGVALGPFWLVNPFLAGLNVILGYLLLRDVYSRRLALLAVLLLAVAPWHLFLGMSLMSHQAALSFALLAGLGAVRFWRTGGRAWCILAGAAAGALSLVRPLDGVAVCVVAAVLIAYAGLRRGSWFSPLALLVASATILGALVLPYNRALTGDPWQPALELYMEEVFGRGRNALGFGPDRGFGWTGMDPIPGHGAIDVLLNADLNLVAIDQDLFGWGSGSLLFALLLLAGGRLTWADGWLLFAIAVVVGLYSLYWFSGGADFGARYWFLVLVPLVALSARGIGDLASRFEKDDRRSRGRVLAMVATLSLLALLVFVPWRAVYKYHRYRQMRPDPRTFVADPELENGLVLVRGELRSDYASAMIYNPLDFEGVRPLFARDASPELRSAVLDAFPQRRAWIMDAPSRTGNGYELVFGPSPPEQVPAWPGP